jgi:Bacterial PH domain
VSGFYWWGPWVLTALVVLMLVRYLSTSYRIDEEYLRAWRILGGRRVRLAEVRRIEYASLRDLSPGGFFAGWGWRGRMWSPRIGRFDSVHTEARSGILVTPEDEPLYISPREPEAFARELSRRVRSHVGRLTVDVGDPLGPAPDPEPPVARKVRRTPPKSPAQ